MMKKLLLKSAIAVIVVMFNRTYAAESPRTIHLPSADVLKKRLTDTNFVSFIEKTDFLKKITFCSLHPVGVLSAFDIALANYQETLSKEMSSEATRVKVSILKDSRAIIVKIVLQDFPEAIKFLQDSKLLPS